MIKYNLVEFNALKARYENITLEEIQTMVADLELEVKEFDADVITNQLTGYGNANTCTLCKAVSDDCVHCVWDMGFWKYFDEFACEYSSSYSEINNANNPEQLLRAFRKRAKRMRRKIFDFETKILPRLIKEDQDRQIQLIKEDQDWQIQKIINKWIVKSRQRKKSIWDWQ